MIRRIVVALVVASWVATVAAPALAFTSVEECQLWMDKLRERTDQVAIAGSDDERKKLLEHVDGAQGDGREGNLRDSIANVKRYQSRAAELTARGKVSRVDGQQLGNLSETVRRCLEAAQRGKSAGHANQPFLGN
jgi:hypothetical protein